MPVPSQSPTSPGATIKRIVISEARFSNRVSIDEIIQHLRIARASGKMVITISQGGVNEIVFTQKEQ